MSEEATTTPAILVAVDSVEAATTALTFARALGEALGLSVGAVHVDTGQAREVQRAVESSGVELQCLSGDPVQELIEAMGAEGVQLGIMGCRHRPTDPAPEGHTAMAVIEQAPKPIIVVPSGSRVATTGRLGHVLVPLDGTVAAAASVDPTVHLLMRTGAEIVVAHVFEPDRAPRYLDQPQHALGAWRHEFLARHADGGDRLVLAAGPASSNVRDVAAAEDVDLVVLGWSRRFGEGRARVIRELLCEAEVPLLLVPVVDVELSHSS